MAGLTQKIYRTLRKVKCDLRRDVSCFTPALAVAPCHFVTSLCEGRFSNLWGGGRQKGGMPRFLIIWIKIMARFSKHLRGSGLPRKKRSAAVRLRSGSAGSRERSRRRSWCGGASQAFGKNANGHPVNLLTEENIGRYLRIPKGHFTEISTWRNRPSPLCGYCPHDVAERLWRAMAGCHNFMHKACTGLVFSEVVFFL